MSSTFPFLMFTFSQSFCHFHSLVIYPDVFSCHIVKQPCAETLEPIPLHSSLYSFEYSTPFNIINVILLQFGIVKYDKFSSLTYTENYNTYLVVQINI